MCPVDQSFYLWASLFDMNDILSLLNLITNRRDYKKKIFRNVPSTNTQHTSCPCRSLYHTFGIQKIKLSQIVKCVSADTPTYDNNITEIQNNTVTHEKMYTIQQQPMSTFVGSSSNGNIVLVCEKLKSKLFEFADVANHLNVIDVYIIELLLFRVFQDMVSIIRGGSLPYLCDNKVRFNVYEEFCKTLNYFRRDVSPCFANVTFCSIGIRESRHTFVECIPQQQQPLLIQLNYVGEKTTIHMMDGKCYPHDDYGHRRLACVTAIEKIFDNSDNFIIECIIVSNNEYISRGQRLTDEHFIVTDLYYWAVQNKAYITYDHDAPMRQRAMLVFGKYLVSRNIRNFSIAPSYTRHDLAKLHTKYIEDMNEYSGPNQTLYNGVVFKYQQKINDDKFIHACDVLKYPKSNIHMRWNNSTGLLQFVETPEPGDQPIIVPRFSCYLLTQFDALKNIFQMYITTEAGVVPFMRVNLERTYKLYNFRHTIDKFAVVKVYFNDFAKTSHGKVILSDIVNIKCCPFRSVLNTITDRFLENKCALNSWI